MTVTIISISNPSSRRLSSNCKTPESETSTSSSGGASERSKTTFPRIRDSWNSSRRRENARRACPTLRENQIFESRVPQSTGAAGFRGRGLARPIPHRRSVHRAGRGHVHPLRWSRIPGAVNWAASKVSCVRDDAVTRDRAASELWRRRGRLLGAGGAEDHLRGGEAGNAAEPSCDHAGVCPRRPNFRGPFENRTRQRRRTASHRRDSEPYRGRREGEIGRAHV